MIEHVEAVAETYHPPVVVLDADGLARAARPRPGAVVLQPAHHVVEGLTVVGVYLVELPPRDVVDVLPALAAVVGHGGAPVLTGPEAARLLLVDPERVEVDVLAPRDVAEGAPAVHRHEELRGDGVDAVLVRRVDADVRVVEAARDDVGLLRDVAPRLAAVVRAPERPLLRLRDGVDDVRRRRRDRDADSTDDLREAPFQLLPSPPAVNRAEQPAALAARR